MISSCTQHCPLLLDQWCERDLERCAVYNRAKAALVQYFKFNSFRPGQLDVLLPALHGRDVFARMATGAGKSLCFFLVPLATSPCAVGVVISPLSALMDQQVPPGTYSLSLVCGGACLEKAWCMAEVGMYM